VNFLDDDKMLYSNLQFDLQNFPRNRRDLKLGYRWAVTDFIDGLDWRQYEALGAVAACLFGAEQVALTPRGNEGGVDLYAVIPNRGQTNIFHGPHAYYRVVGQSKRYTDPVAVGKTREFIQVLDNVRHQSLVIQNRIPSWFRNLNGPIIGWMNAHAGFQSGSIDIAHSHGIIISDTLTLCESLLLVRSTPAAKTEGELRDYFASKILEQLNP
jgi:Restriction endonuclease